MLYPAHIRIEAHGLNVQTAVQHCRNTASYVGQCLRCVNLEQTGFLLGLIHDCGKFKDEFAEYIMKPDGVRGSVNHTFAGCRLLLERYHTTEAPTRMLAAELMAVAVGSHHGLFDCIDSNRKSGFLHRMTKADIGYEESRDNFFAQCTSETELDKLFELANSELECMFQKFAAEDVEEYLFQLGLLSRLLLSALIEGDRRDTAEFMCGIKYPPLPENMATFWELYLDRVEEKLDHFPVDTALCRMRKTISDRCRAFADQQGGIYRLNIPTGGGKTLSSLRYALAHAKKWNKRRLIFTAPLLSILEQNAAVLRSFLNDDSIILEHHSNVLETDESGELDQRELAVESWNSPVIITTLVQLLNILFAGGSSSIRRFHSLCDSVIVIDEIQTVPAKMLTLFNQAMDFLVKVCGTTVLFCSATQPCLEKAEHPLRTPVQEVVPYDEKTWEPFRRTTITDLGGKTLEEIAEFAIETLNTTRSLLIVCNRKDEAEYLFAQLREQAEESCHLSASMCMAHRRETLERVNAALAGGKKCLCVATQVIEAGVDISFERVIRLTAGMDSIIQAAGRCNRHGESREPVPVYVVNCLGENLSRLRDIHAGKSAALSLLEAFRRDPKRFDRDLTSDEAIRTYYEKLYADMPKNYQNYALESPRTTLFDLLSSNMKLYDEGAPYAGMYLLPQAFKLAGQIFSVFDSNARDLIVPYGDGKARIEELTSQTPLDLDFLSAWVKRARPYTVAAYDWQLKVLGNAVTEYAGIAVLAPEFYNKDTGLCLQPMQSEFLEV